MTQIQWCNVRYRGEMADITFVCDVVYSVCDVMNAVDVMWSLQWCKLKEWM